MINTNDTRFLKVCCFVFEHLQLQGELFVEVDIVDSDTILHLNHELRGVDKATDVLSFGIVEVTPSITKFERDEFAYEYSETYNAILLGSIVICESVAKNQAKEYGQSLDCELQYLFLHGLLHLLGYDHITEKDKDLMRMREKEIVRLLKLDNL
ncbi:MAG: rRNA maturation RNase YbeY [Clostridiales bacterium]|jgi:probable rRNA maturation factor|nr:rRNA maturation RNase YbeY [Clostridiales bacterium]